jgi:transposase-like protein
MKSNLAIHEEHSRLTAYLKPTDEPSCPIESCRHHGIAVSTPKAYYSFGTTTAGAKRYRCRECSKTFSVSKNPTTRQRLPEKNEEIFRFLVNKVPFKRMCELADVAMDTLYRKIDFIYRQCLGFAGAQESSLGGMHIRRLYLSVDRQDHIINWKNADDKRNIILNALGTADNESGYVFGIHVNYDPHVSAQAIEVDAAAIGDIELRQPFRRYARLWLDQDYRNTLTKSSRRKGSRKRLGDDIRAGYESTENRDDVERPDWHTIDTSLPDEGMLVHSDYTLYAHFRFLRDLFRNVEKTRFFLDQESGIRAACLSAFTQEVLEKRCDAFYVRVNKELTINEKRRLKANSQREMQNLRDSDSILAELSDYELRLVVIKQRMKELVEIGKWNDRWLFYPFPDMSEPQKAICWLTDLQDRSYNDDHVAKLYSKATLHGIDRFFMQARRRLSLLERPLATSSSQGRRWYGYNPYNPTMVGKLLDIFRVFYNFVEVGGDKRTPAMRIGLQHAPSTFKEILY